MFSYGRKKPIPSPSARRPGTKDALKPPWHRSKSSSAKGAVMKLGANVAMQVDAISTGSLSLDIALGVGGMPAAA